MSDKPEISRKSKEISKGVGEFLNGSTQVLANGTGFILEKTTELGSKIGGEVSGKIAERASGAQSSTVQKARFAGQIVGGAAVGLVTGEVIGAAETGLTAASATASTATAISSISGAAASNATLAAIGGGALTAGGGGMAAGQEILNGINVGYTMVGGITGVKNKPIQKSE